MTGTQPAPRHKPGSAPERFGLGMALLVPLAVVMALMQVPATSLASHSTRPQVDVGLNATLSKRPVASNPTPPPTLAPPTATPRATATQVPPTPESKPTTRPQPGGTYTVQPADELKQIAAEYGVSISRIVDTNDIPNPDSLRIGQVLHIPAH